MTVATVRSAPSPAGVVLLAVLGAGCAVSDPASLMAVCVEAMPVGGTGTAECDLGRPVWVVAVPRGTVTAGDLTELGVPDSAARAMTWHREREDRWYAIEGGDAHFEIVCTESGTSFVRASAAYGRRFLVTVKASGVEAVEVVDR